MIISSFRSGKSRGNLPKQQGAHDGSQYESTARQPFFKISADFTTDPAHVLLTASSSSIMNHPLPPPENRNNKKNTTTTTTSSSKYREMPISPRRRSSMRRTLLLLVLLWMTCLPTVAFTPLGTSQMAFRRSLPASPLPRSTRTTLQATVEEMRAEAERVRLEAELLEQRLTLSKIERLEEKLGNKNWLAKHPEEEQDLERQLEALQRKLHTDPTNGSVTYNAATYNATTTSSSLYRTAVDKNENYHHEADAVRKAEVVAAESSSSRNGAEEETTVTGTETTEKSVSSLESKPHSESRKKSTRREAEENPICGFDQDDLEAYLPIAQQIEVDMPNSTIDEKLVTFRAAPELQQHFQDKIRAMILQPMEDMQKLEELRSQFLYTRSRVEKENLRRQINQMEKDLEQNGPFGYSESIFADIPPMSEEEANDRREAIEALPPVMQAMYTRRTKAPDGDIELAIQLDHYEQQVQLLDQVKFVTPWSDVQETEARKGIESLPIAVRNHIANGLGLESGKSAKEMLEKLIESESDSESVKEWSNMQDLVVAAGASDEEADDLDFIDRSRYAEEFYPSIARMEGKHPSIDDMDLFIKEIVDRRAFMVQSKPERVIGGWYLRGTNLLSEDEDGIRLVKCLLERLEASPTLAEKVEFFYIPDPSPLADEDFEMDMPAECVLYVTGKDPAAFYNNGNGLTKFSVSTLGIASIALFSLASVEMMPALQDRMDAALTSGAEEDLEWLLSIVQPVFLSMVGIYSAHEVGHALIALRDKFKTGFGAPIPSIQTGFIGAITPLESPPPSLKSMFDFAIAGPLFGFCTSLVLFVIGLQETAAADMSASLDLPGLPTFLLRSSALCSGLVEYFLGRGTLLPGVSLPTDAVLPLHPFAISGYTGLVVNSLALLPLGSKCALRMAQTFFFAPQFSSTTNNHTFSTTQIPTADELQ
eukprot:scaffold473_cov156-Amphora_coffeaeformis.AAC.17